MSADSSSVQISAVRETVWGTTPPAAALQIVRITGESLIQDQGSRSSAELRADGQRGNPARVSVSASGAINQEVSYGAPDIFLDAALRTTWPTSGTGFVDIQAQTTISAANSDNSFNDSANGFTDVAVGQWVKVQGFTNAANNGYFRVVSQTAAKIVVTGGDGALVTEAASNAITITGTLIQNAVERVSFSIEKQFTDLTNQRIAYRGMRVGTMGLSISPDQILTAVFGFQGDRATNETTSIGSSYVAAPTGEVQNAVDNVAGVWLGQGATKTKLAHTALLSLNMNFDNQLRAQPEVGRLGARGIGLGTMQLTGRIVLYHADATDHAKFLAFATEGITVITQDAAGDAYAFDIYAAKYTSQSGPTAPGQNRDVTDDFAFEAFADPLLGKTIGVTRMPA